MDDRQQGWSFRQPEPVSHEAFRKTEGYRELCEEFGVDPAAPWDKETVESIEAAVEFLRRYESMRNTLAAWTPQTVAAYMESLVLLHESDAGAMIWRERWGAVLAVTDPIGDHWMITAQPYDPARAAAAMAMDRAEGASQQ
jgi:hypothetical protein